MDRSLKFYCDVFGLKETARGGGEEQGALYVLLRDPRSGQKLELNWYSPDPKKSIFGTPYVVGEALDHLEVRVENVSETLKRLEKLGIEAVDMRPYFEPHEYPFGTNSKGHHMAFIQDPDGIQICLYDHPEEPLDTQPGNGY
jgi:catechol 2,3-dioxygenase-like lactoylglutathione lyase family enzyme